MLIAGPWIVRVPDCVDVLVSAMCEADLAGVVLSMNHAADRLQVLRGPGGLPEPGLQDGVADRVSRWSEAAS